MQQAVGIQNWFWVLCSGISSVSFSVKKKKPLKKWNSTTGNYEFFGLKILLMNANNSRRWQKFLKNSDAFEAGNHDFFNFFKKREIEWVIDNDNNRQWQKDKIKGLDTYTTAR